MLRTHRFPLFAAALGVGVATAMYCLGGDVRPVAEWRAIDIASEAAIALMACLWFVVVLSSRPAGRATTLLAAGLAGLMIGAWSDCMDEFFMVPKSAQWNHWIESGVTLSGMISLTWGLLYWRQEQFVVAEHLQKRERLFRDHRSFDALTQIGDAEYLREQLRIEYARGGTSDCTLLMFDIDSFHLVNRQHGQREGDRLLQAVTHTLLLNIRHSDLLCRYAGDRFAVLIPGDEPAAGAMADQLRRAVACLRHHAQADGQPIQVTMRHAARRVDAEPRQLLKELNIALERPLVAPASSLARQPSAAATA